MEGYTNVIGSSYDFDDLDIEGRVVDEWNVEDEKKTSNFRGPKVDEKAILSERVKLDNGQQANVFSVVRKKDNIWYTCHVCSDTMVSLSLLRQHVETKKHQTNMKTPIHPGTKFVKLDPKENLALEPGEPVPPGLEEVIIKNCVIQPKLDAYKSSPLIGLEFMVELTESTVGLIHSEGGMYYHCLLCDKNGNERNMIIHFTSIFHYMKYLCSYFPAVAAKLNALPNKRLKKSFGLLVTDIVADIEAKYGRMKPCSETHAQMNTPGRKEELLNAIRNGPHFRQTEDFLFDEKVTVENLDRKCKELQSAAPPFKKIEDSGKNDENESSESKFNKTGRLNMDKKQLRSRDEANLNSSPDIQLIDIQLPKSPVIEKKKRSRSLSSISTASSSSRSRSRGGYRSHSRHRSKPLGHLRSHRRRSRSRSPGSFHHRRHMSPVRRYSPGRRSRDRSPARRWNRDRRGYSPDSYRSKGIDRFGRSRDSKHRRERIIDDESPKDIGSSEEKIRWAKFREDLKKIESVKLEKLKYHEKNPEKHPQYPEEWKAFWNRRYNELQRSGVDPTKHDFKPEWISFWTKRMKELYEEDLGKAKDELKKKFDLPEDPGDQNEKGMVWKHMRKRNNTSPGLVDVSPPTPDKKDVMADIKTTWKAFTGSDIKDTPKRPLSPWEEDSKTRDYSPPMKKEGRKHSPTSRSMSPPISNDKLLEDMPQRKTRTSSLIFVLRKLTVLEQQLGSLAPKVFEMLSQSLALEKIKEDASLDLLLEEENCVFLETVREKIIALLCAGVVPRNIVNTSRSAIKHIDIALYLSSKRERSLPAGALKMGLHLGNPNLLPSQYSMQSKSEPVVVQGVGKVDKVAIAQQIAAALIEQGKTDVTEAELEQLINAVVGMAEASINSAQPMTTANFLHQLQSMQNSAASARSFAVMPSGETSAPVFQLPTQNSVNVNQPQVLINNSQPQAAFGALKLLQSAYNDAHKPEQESPKLDIVDSSASTSLQISDQELAATLGIFNKISKDEQPNFIQRLQTTNPEMYKRLCPFIPSSVITLSDRSKRSPITISISKEKSEQKIKPLASGRLSPFSSRTGGANPVGDEVIVDDDEDEKTDVKFIAETKLKPQSTHKQDISKYKSDVEDDDDDDDDYSFEDVYKAAQEKLKQKQLDEDKKNNKPMVTKEMYPNQNLGNSLKESSIINIGKSLETTSNNNITLSSASQEKHNSGGNISHQQMPSTYLSQHTSKTENDLNTNEIPALSSQSNPYDSVTKTNPYDTVTKSIPYDTVSKSNSSDTVTNSNRYDNATESNPYGTVATSLTPNYQETFRRHPQTDMDSDPSHQSYGGGDPYQNYSVKDQYSNESMYCRPNNEYYENRGQYYQDPQYSSDNNPQRDVYETPYRDTYNYNAPTNYGNQISTYEEQYRYKDRQYGSDNYDHGYPYDRYNSADYAQRYPNPNYPPY